MKCLVWFCQNRPKRGKFSVDFFRLTKDRAQSWLKALGRDENENISISNRICSEHFKPEDFFKLHGKTRLRKGAVPSVCLKLMDSKRKKCDKNLNQVVHDTCEQHFPEIKVESEDDSDSKSEDDSDSKSEDDSESEDHSEMEKNETCSMDLLIDVKHKNISEICSYQNFTESIENVQLEQNDSSVLSNIKIEQPEDFTEKEENFSVGQFCDREGENWEEKNWFDENVSELVENIKYEQNDTSVLSFPKFKLEQSEVEQDECMKDNFIQSEVQVWDQKDSLLDNWLQYYVEL